MIVAYVLALTLLAAGATAEPARQPLSAPVARHQGVSWVGGRSPVTSQDFDRLVANGVQWIAQNPFGWQRGLGSPEIVLRPDAGWWGETDRGLAETARLARSRGIRTLLRPHLWVAGPQGHGGWSGDIAMRSEDDWSRWFQSYRSFILHYAALAEREGIEVLCVGAELKRATRGREADWRRLIAGVREAYHGQLTYAANWDGEYEQIGFWDALDFVGVQAYFPLAEGERPTLDQLKAGWAPHLRSLERLSRSTGKRVLFTEIGYRSAPGAASRPWEWGSREGGAATRQGLALQADAYEAFFQAAWRADWLAGAYFWKWYPGLERRGAPPGEEFSPQNKPAERILAKWYGGTGQGR